MPKPSADHDRLGLLCGDWRGTETMHPSPWDPRGGTAEGHTRSRRALAGVAVLSDYQQRRGGVRTFEDHGVYTWDPAAREVVLHWFDGMGQGREQFRGTWHGDQLVPTSHNPQGRMRLRCDCARPGVLVSGMETSMDGRTWSKLFDGTYHRAP
ncbi:MAG: DUF1579 family protein [Planctomycetes bacterium]|nr:DUF1579 family protein [Planctomycetota bacterium]